jgi:aldehyde:ferredoxin oxidoreductase
MSEESEAMKYGYNGKILHVDLTTQNIAIEEPSAQFYRLYGGGSAMGCYYLLKEMPGGVDPLSPENLLTIFVSPVTGAPVPGQSRVTICAKSPLSGAIGDSQGGGFWAAHFKMTGFDGIVIKGKADKPVYLWIHDEIAEIRDASHLWGHITGDVEREIQRELGDKSIDVLQIGPAGEKLVRFANIINMCNRANGRTGMGAVMGSKNLKAIAIQGKRKPTFFNPLAIRDLARWGAEHFNTSDVYGLGIHGTANVLEGQQNLGGLPTRNWTSGIFEGHQAINGVTLHDTVLKERDTCFACIIRCKRVVEITDGDYKVDPVYGGPEYETLATFGSFCGVNDLAAISKANEICNKYGMDTISCGATIAWAMDCYEHGIVSTQDSGGIHLNFGNAASMVKMVELIAKREGFGDVLAEGSARAAEKFGSIARDFLVTIKNHELPAHMPEAKRSLALIYAINPYGADHQSHEHDPSYTPEFSYIDRMAEIGLMDPQPLRDLNAQKIRYAMYTQWVYSACNSFCVCQFVYGPAWHLFSTGQLVELIRAATSWNFSLFELMKVGERTLNMQRAFNAREGFTSIDDALPKKLFQPRIGGPTDGVSIPLEQFTTALQIYYQMAGWDQDGRPTRAKLDELGIGWVSEMIASD